MSDTTNVIDQQIDVDSVSVGDATVINATKPNKREANILIGIPCQEMVNVQFVNSLLQLQRPAHYTITFTQSSILPQSRDTLASMAIDNNFTHILFIDSDMTFPANALYKLFQHDVDICTGLCFARKGDHNPCIYKSINYENPVRGVNNGNIVVEDDIERDFFEVKACGMAFCLIKTSVLVDIRNKNNGELFRYVETFGEDLSFCVRALKAGYKIWCDGTIPIGHVGEQVFGKTEYYLTKQINEAKKRAMEEAAKKNEEAENAKVEELKDDIINLTEEYTDDEPTGEAPMEESVDDTNKPADILEEFTNNVVETYTIE